MDFWLDQCPNFGMSAWFLPKCTIIFEKQNVIPRSLVKIQYCEEPSWPRGAFSASNRQGSNFECCVYIWTDIGIYGQSKPCMTIYVEWTFFERLQCKHFCKDGYCISNAVYIHPLTLQNVMNPLTNNYLFPLEKYINAIIEKPNKFMYDSFHSYRYALKCNNLLQ